MDLPIEIITDQPPEEIAGEVIRRVCAVCKFSTYRAFWVPMAPAKHKCRRDEVDVMVYWPGWSG